ncbi:MAG: pyridoxamine 5'-phosphate oxidase family protein [Candidatus Omnitrophota bacterium]
MIPKKIRKILDSMDFIAVATCNLKMQTSAVYKFLLKVEDDTIYLVDFVKGKTWQNIRINPKISLSVMDRDDYINYQINGSAHSLIKGLIYKQLLEEFSKKQIDFYSRRIIEGIRRGRAHKNINAPFPRQLTILRIKVEEVVELGPAAEARRGER